MIELLTKDDFDKLLANNQDKLIFVKFSAPWCSPCRLLTSIIDEITPIDGVVFAEVNVDDAEEDFVNEFNVRNIPTVVIYKDGLQVDRFTGMIGKESLENKIKENLEK